MAGRLMKTPHIAMIRYFEAQRVRGVAERFDTFADALTGRYTRRLTEGV